MPRSQCRLIVPNTTLKENCARLVQRRLSISRKINVAISLLTGMGRRAQLWQVMGSLLSVQRSTMLECVRLASITRLTISSTTNVVQLLSTGIRLLQIV